jgi:hypothetical protein
MRRPATVAGRCGRRTERGWGLRKAGCATRRQENVARVEVETAPPEEASDAAVERIELVATGRECRRLALGGRGSTVRRRAGRVPFVFFPLGRRGLALVRVRLLVVVELIGEMRAQRRIPRQGIRWRRGATWVRASVRPAVQLPPAVVLRQPEAGGRASWRRPPVLLFHLADRREPDRAAPIRVAALPRWRCRPRLRWRSAHQTGAFPDGCAASPRRCRSRRNPHSMGGGS